MLMCGSWYFYPRLCGTIINCLCGYCCLNGASIALMTSRFYPMGEICSWNIAPVNYEGNLIFDDKGDSYQTYQDDANLMLGLGVVQFILSCAQCTLCCIPLATTPIGEAKKKEKKNKKNKDKKSKDKQEMQ